MSAFVICMGRYHCAFPANDQMPESSHGHYLTFVPSFWNASVLFNTEHVGTEYILSVSLKSAADMTGVVSLRSPSLFAKQQHPAHASKIRCKLGGRDISRPYTYPSYFVKWHHTRSE